MQVAVHCFSPIFGVGNRVDDFCETLAEAPKRAVRKKLYEGKV